MFLHQIILNGVFDNNGLRPISFSTRKGEYYIINKLLYTEYWKYGLEKYVVSIKNETAQKVLLYDKHREKWFILIESAIDTKDIQIK